ncbi:zinc finger protein 131 isoform X1 [Triplophysa rosa]|uniref:Znf131 protein n=1 Tax=Triplophysa rosa TaxID=992332 RepID=A0A9W7TKF9_TRIRA|nr:zinc finger protein 131 isoform X1 [Triplophysa rosa]XP_057212339.1 zinc finger protein 131 isoform X1 [Triplophysa rosa]XP_057212340.1 zinc finger protein 131 isoform X1 [Triplophysa rosa]XP_057212341.1 zinc finger protein 131 isoform X1 [Triplophysa rosa]XP_057212342.1 zinc finger protein 131 isoform X1 [Triplophysa rosa]KAI7797692.1 Znf131 protein [Triplophysa rosa]
MSVDGDVDDCGHEFPAHYKVMLDKLNEQRQLDQFTDITLIVDGHQFRAHKAVLAACSQFFHKFFQDFTQEPLVEIEGVSNTAFRHLMEFTYTATLAVNGEAEVNDVWRAAEYLQMQEAIKALDNRRNGTTSSNSPQGLAGKSKAKKRKIAETFNVITETLPSVESESVEIEVEVGEDHIEVEESGLVEVVDAARTTAEPSSDDSALALLADITSKYQQGEQTLHVVKKEDDSVVVQEETVMASKTLENIEVVEVQISQLDNLFRCDKCDRCFKLYYHLKQHMKSHTAAPERGFVCRHCGKAYAREGALKQHLNNYHFEAEEQSRRQKKKVHVCEYCEKQFDHFGHFKEHLRKHTGEKPFECPECHERFARNSTLKCHMSACQNGSGAKKGRKKLYECQVCSSVFNSWDQFKDHLVTHTGEKPNHCTICDQWFTQPRDLQTHLLEFHGLQQKVIVTEEVIIADPTTVLTMAEVEEGYSEDGMRVEHITVEPMDVVAVEETLVVEEETTLQASPSVGGVEEAVVLQVEDERLREQPVEIHIEQVTVSDTADSEIQPEAVDSLNENVEIANV